MQSKEGHRLRRNLCPSSSIDGSIRFLIAVAARYSLSRDQMDVTTAFLHGELQDEIYMKQPEAYTLVTDQNVFADSKKSLYGLKQASRCWSQKLDKALKTFGMAQAKYDPSIYHRSKNGQILIVAIYVDDLILVSNDNEGKQKLKTYLKSLFQMKDIGTANYILKMRIS